MGLSMGWVGLDPRGCSGNAALRPTGQVQYSLNENQFQFQFWRVDEED